MNAGGKYLFDLTGYLVLKDVLTAEEVAQFNASIDRHRDLMGEIARSPADDSQAMQGTLRCKDLGSMLAWEQPWCEPFRKLQLCRVFRKYVSPKTPVEMLKKKSAAQNICDQFGKGFRAINEVQSAFQSRPMPDEALCAILWEYKDRGEKGYDLTERLFAIIREGYSELDIIGPECAGKDVPLGEIFENYPKPDRPVDFVLLSDGNPIAIGLARYDSDRGGTQEDDRTGQYRDCASEILGYAESKGIDVKVIFLNDGPGLLLGSM